MSAGPEDHAGHTARGVASISLACLGIASMATLARAMSGRLPVGQLVFLRFAVSLVPVAAAFAVQRRLPDLRRPRLLALRGLFGGLGVTGYFLSLEHLPVGPATLLNNTSPAFATVLAAWFLHERLRPRRAAGLLLAMAGAAVVAWDAAASAQHTWGARVGVAAGLGSAVAAGGALTSMRALRADTDSLSVLFSFCVCGVALTAPLAALDWRPLSGAVLWASLGVGLLSAFGQFMLSYGYKFVPVSVGSTTGLLTTVFSWALGAAFLAEGLSLRAFAGALLCAAGILFTAQSG